MNNARIKWLVLAVGCACVFAGATAWWVTDWALHRHATSHTHDHSAQDLHAWMHEHLDLTPEQHERLEPAELEFEQHRTRLKESIRAAAAELAATISDANVDEERLKKALERLNQSQGDLQRLTLDHFFTMKRHLRPAQARKLVEWTCDSLARQP